jgi:xylulokinase
MFSVYLAAGSGAARPPRASGLRTMADFVGSRWGAEPATDWSAAARTGLFDVERCGWSSEILDAVLR